MRKLRMGAVRDIHLIVLHHTATAVNTLTWHDIREHHVAKGWRDIGYHFGIVLDGTDWSVAIGRDVGIQGAHAKGHNKGSIGVAFEGNFENGPVHERQLTLGLHLLTDLCMEHDLNPLTDVLGHRELPYATLCPGKYFPIDRIRGELTDRLRWRKLDGAES